MSKSAIPAYITSLIRHFEDLRDGTHGGSASRKDKEAHFKNALHLLAPIARHVLTEMNSSLLLDTGQITETGLRRTADRGLNASWALSWPEQRAAGVVPIVLQASMPIASVVRSRLASCIVVSSSSLRIPNT